MKSGLEGRNNLGQQRHDETRHDRPVSMKSGLEGRNNMYPTHADDIRILGLNEVRPRRPEQ